MQTRSIGACGALALSALFALPGVAQSPSTGTLPNGANVPGDTAPSSGTPGTVTPGMTSKSGLPPAPAEMTGPPVPPAKAGATARRPGTDASTRMAPPATTQSPTTRARARQAFSCDRIADRAERARCAEERDRPASAPR